MRASFPRNGGRRAAPQEGLREAHRALARVERQAHVAQDHCQLIVEVVRDETRERVHHLQLLLSTERLFDLWLAGRIFGADISVNRASMLAVSGAHPSAPELFLRCLVTN